MMSIQRSGLSSLEGAKNRFRNRTIPLNPTAFEAMTWILERWKKLGGNSDEHYILPHRPRTPRGTWILTEPMGSIATAFTQIRIAANLRHFRLYDCRVQAITKLLSNPMVSSQVSKEIAGHISDAMQSRYSIQRFDTKKAALDALDCTSTATVPLSPLESVQPEVQKSGTAGGAQTHKPERPLSEAEIAMRAEIDLLKAELTRVHRYQPFDPHKWRHQLCTEMLEQGVPTENVIGVLGRVSENMLEAYKHTNLRAKEEALGMARANIIAFPGQTS